ncbi:MAG: hypothetical protein HRT88_07170 [Lentisphaeraceae bacterium]|nr:hypothetical protein [Lentisphaeraceae bacterium]
MDNSDDYITLRYTTQVDDTVNSPDTLINAAQFGWDKGSGVTFGPTSTDSVSVVEPSLQISKTIDTPTSGIDAGDFVEYTITVQHDGLSTSDAFGLSLTDNIPTQLGSLTIIAATDTAGVLTTADYEFSGNTLQLKNPISTFAQTRIISVSIRGTVLDSTHVETIIDNKASSSFSSLSGSDANEKLYNQQSSTVSTTLTSPEILQFINTSEVTNTLDNDPASSADDDEINDATNNTDYLDTDWATIGETITVTIKIQMPEGTLPDVSILSELPSGITYLGNATAISPDGGSIDLSGKILNSGASGDDVTFVLGDLVNQASISGDQLIITFDASIDNSSSVGISAAESKNFAISSVLSYTGKDALNADLPNKTVNSLVDEINVLEPTLDISINIINIQDQNHLVTGGAVVYDGYFVTYQVVIDNPNISPDNSHAFDLLLSNNIPNGQSLLTSSINVTGGSGIIDSSSADKLDISVDKLDLGSQLVVDFTTQIKRYSGSLDNIADIEWSSLPGVITGERQGNGTFDDYDNSDNVAIQSEFIEYEVHITCPVMIASAGEEITYTISGANNGSTTGSGVYIEFALPKHTSLDLSKNPGWVELTTGVYRYQVGNLAQGASFPDVALKLDVDYILPGAITLPLTVTIADDSTHGIDSIIPNNTSSIEILLCPLADSQAQSQIKNDSSSKSISPTNGDKYYGFESFYTPIALMPHIAPIFSGSAQPGSMVTLIINDSRGQSMRQETVMADIGGNWQLSFDVNSYIDYRVNDYQNLADRHGASETAQKTVAQHGSVFQSRLRSTISGGILHDTPSTQIIFTTQSYFENGPGFSKIFLKPSFNSGTFSIENLSETQAASILQSLSRPLSDTFLNSIIQPGIPTGL